MSFNIHHGVYETQYKNITYLLLTSDVSITRYSQEMYDTHV